MAETFTLTVEDTDLILTEHSVDLLDEGEVLILAEVSLSDLDGAVFLDGENQTHDLEITIFSDNAQLVDVLELEITGDNTARVVVRSDAEFDYETLIATGEASFSFEIVATDLGSGEQKSAGPYEHDIIDINDTTQPFIMSISEDSGVVDIYDAPQRDADFSTTDRSITFQIGGGVPGEELHLKLSPDTTGWRANAGEADENGEVTFTVNAADLPGNFGQALLLPGNSFTFITYTTFDSDHDIYSSESYPQTITIEPTSPGLTISDETTGESYLGEIDDETIRLSNSTDENGLSTAEPNTLIAIYDGDGQLVTEVMSDNQGEWSVDLQLSEGAHEFYATHIYLQDPLHESPPGEAVAIDINLNNDFDLSVEQAIDVIPEDAFDTLEEGQALTLLTARITDPDNPTVILAIDYGTGILPDGATHLVSVSDFSIDPALIDYLSLEISADGQSVSVVLEPDAAGVLDFESLQSHAVSFTIQASDGEYIHNLQHTSRITDVNEISLDLDLDDSSGATGGDYQATHDTLASKSVSIADHDTIISDDMGSQLSEVRVKLTGSFDANYQSLIVDADKMIHSGIDENGNATLTLPGGITISTDSGTGELILRAPDQSGASAEDFQAVIEMISLKQDFVLQEGGAANSSAYPGEIDTDATALDGFIQITEAGRYEFRIDGADAASLFIGDARVPVLSDGSDGAIVSVTIDKPGLTYLQIASDSGISDAAISMRNVTAGESFTEVHADDIMSVYSSAMPEGYVEDTPYRIQYFDLYNIGYTGYQLANQFTLDQLDDMDPIATGHFDTMNPNAIFGYMAFGNNDKYNPDSSLNDDNYNYTDYRPAHHNDNPDDNWYNYFGVKIDTNITISEDQAGTYTFRLSGDEGRSLSLDGVDLLEGYVKRSGQSADGVQEITVELTPGTHSLSAAFFESEGAQNLYIDLKGPNDNDFRSLHDHFTDADNGISFSSPQSGLIQYEIWDGTPPNNTLDNLSQVTQNPSLGSGRVTDFNVNHLAKDYGITGETESNPDNFTVRFKFSIEVAEDGWYNFNSGSDDGMQLFHESGLLIQQDGSNEFSQSYSDNVYLTKGVHDFAVDYFDLSGRSGLTIGMKAVEAEDTPITPEGYTQNLAFVAPVVDQSAVADMLNPQTIEIVGVDVDGNVSEPVETTISLEVYDTNLAPVVTLENIREYLEESNDPSVGTVVADINLENDNQGTVELTLTGRDADNFHIITDGEQTYLALKPGVDINYEHLGDERFHFDVTVVATDPTMTINNSTSDSMTLNIVDVDDRPSPFISYISDDSGAVDVYNDPGQVGGFATTDRTITLHITNGEPGERISIKLNDGTSWRGGATADENGEADITINASQLPGNYGESQLLPGNYTFVTYTSYDWQNGLYSKSTAQSITIEPTSPGVMVVDDVTGTVYSGEIADDTVRITNDVDANGQSTADPNTIIVVYNNGDEIGRTTSDANGNWSIDAVLTEGTHNINASHLYHEASGNESPLGNTVQLDVDFPEATTPVITGISDDTQYAGDGYTTDKTLLIHGTGEPGEQIDVFIDGIKVATTVVDGAGNWTADNTDQVLDLGSYNITATATTSYGGVSDTSAPSSAYEANIITREPPAISQMLDDDGNAINASGTNFTATDRTETITLKFTGGVEGQDIRVKIPGYSWRGNAGPADENGEATLVIDVNDLPGNQGADLLIPGNYEFIPYTQYASGIWSSEGARQSLNFEPKIAYFDIVDNDNTNTNYTGEIGDSTIRLQGQQNPDGTGVAHANTVIDLFKNGSWFRAVTSDENGNWFYDITLTEGEAVTFETNSVYHWPSENWSGLGDTARSVTYIADDAPPELMLDADNVSGAGGVDFRAESDPAETKLIKISDNIEIAVGGDGNIQSATVELHQSGNRYDDLQSLAFNLGALEKITDGNNVSYVLPGGIQLDSAQSSDGKLVLVGMASADDYEAALQAIGIDNAITVREGGMVSGIETAYHYNGTDYEYDPFTGQSMETYYNKHSSILDIDQAGQYTFELNTDYYFVWAGGDLGAHTFTANGVEYEFNWTYNSATGEYDGRVTVPLNEGPNAIKFELFEEEFQTYSYWGPDTNNYESTLSLGDSELSTPFMRDLSLEHFAGKTDDSPFHFEFFDLTGSTSSSARQIDSLNPVVTGHTSSMNPNFIAMNEVDTGFWNNELGYNYNNYNHANVGTNYDNFGLKIATQLVIETPGVYKFHTESDDGSIMYINGEEVVLNDGLHGATTTKTVEVLLGAGPVDIEFKYFERGGSELLQLRAEGPDFNGIEDLTNGHDHLYSPNFGMVLGYIWDGTPDTFDINDRFGVSDPLTSSQLEPVDHGYYSDINVNKMAYDAGLGVNDADNFQAYFFQSIEIEQGGWYTFKLGSDDASRFSYLPAGDDMDQTIIDMNYAQSYHTKTGSIYLEPGVHSFVTYYMENTGDAKLSLEMKGPDTGGTFTSNLNLVRLLGVNDAAEILSETSVDFTVTDSSGQVSNTAETTNKAALPPIFMDMNGDGVITYLNDTVVENTVTFDGMVLTNWMGAGDGILAYDMDGDGIIAYTEEIAFASYIEGALTDLEGLSYFDTNQDGLLDASDAQWGSFFVWQDANADGISQADELTRLDDVGYGDSTVVGIENIVLASDGNYDKAAVGVQEYGQGEFNLNSGAVAKFADVALSYDVVTEPVAAESEVAQFPDLSELGMSGDYFMSAESEESLMIDTLVEVLEAEALASPKAPVSLDSTMEDLTHVMDQDTSIEQGLAEQAEPVDIDPIDYTIAPEVETEITIDTNIEVVDTSVNPNPVEIVEGTQDNNSY